MSGRVSMKEPVCLVESDSEGNLHVNPASQDILNQIDQHVVVVAVVGLYRTGKSYLMNKLAGKNKGFALGSTSQSKTKGIWMWCVPHPLKADLTLVLLDTEGLGDVEKGDNKNNIWIFSLAVLLSSTLVYNSMGNIDNKALENLHYVTELTEHIKTKSGQTEDDEAEYMRFFPSFVWTVRDFTLELELDGKPITADEYLEYALKLKPGTSKKIQEYNLPRECLRKYFTPRKCFVFDFPTTGKKVKRLGELTDADLEPDFVQQSNDFCTHIFTNSKTKTLKGGILVTGRLLGNLAETYVATIRSGQIPCLDNAVLALSEIENSGAVERSRVFYQKNNAVLVPLEEKGSSAYAVPGGYNKYCSDIQKLTEEYKNTKGKGVMAEEVFKMYLDGLTNLGQIILATDKSLSEAEQRAKEAEAKAELAKQEHHAAQELMMLQKRLQEGQERTYQQLINDLMEKMEVDMRQASAEYQSGAKLEVQNNLLKNGYYEKA